MLETIAQNTDEKNQRCAVCQCHLNLKKSKMTKEIEPHTMFTDWRMQHSIHVDSPPN